MFLTCNFTSPRHPFPLKQHALLDVNNFCALQHKPLDALQHNSYITLIEFKTSIPSAETTEI